MNVTKYFAWSNVLIAVLVAGLLFFGDIVLFTLACVTIFVVASARTVVSSASIETKACMIVVYFMIMIVQIATDVNVVFAAENAMWIEQFARRLFGTAILFLPLSISRYVSAGKYSVFYLPSIQEAATISFSELDAGIDTVKRTMERLRQAGKSMSSKNLRTVFDDLPRHDSFRYINNGSLTAAYFAEAAKSLADPHIYIVISNTGSVASEIISVFTQRQYNHASLSFDRELRTIISYNGGERVYPPGLNREMVAFFNKKPGASILIYSLECSKHQKKNILDKVEEINREGSAYNLMGLVLKYSHKPNIMFCSQFVYKMLNSAGLSYFAKADGNVRPTDLIELDYYKKLRFVHEIKLN
ncbi:MAG: hypothetical protein LBB57_00295 [Clostridiales Family XIII bacterium]|jgi:hypothetical protein|nr:hypothetical protein [Clostridiales Family XIII bacterium]